MIARATIRVGVNARVAFMTMTSSVLAGPS
jgi:hypothetical protein